MSCFCTLVRMIHLLWLCFDVWFWQVVMSEIAASPERSLTQLHKSPLFHCNQVLFKRFWTEYRDLSYMRKFTALPEVTMVKGLLGPWVGILFCSEQESRSLIWKILNMLVNKIWWTNEVHLLITLEASRKWWGLLADVCFGRIWPIKYLKTSLWKNLVTS